MKRFLPILFLLLSLLPLTVATGSTEPPPPTNSPEEIEGVVDAIEAAIAVEQDAVLAFIVSKIDVQHVAISADGSRGVGWLIPTDPETGQPAPIEPGLALTVRERGDWQVWLPSSDGWIDRLKEAPEDVLSPEMKDVWVNRYETQAVAVPTTALGGYLLPWEAGVTRNLTQSTCHDDYIPSGNAHYSFDFSTYDVLWNIYASKAGKVWLWKDDVPTCYEATCSDTQPLGNYIVLKDETTSPVTYQLYLHLAQGSIPPELKVQGTPVARGQFIGVVDNTGQSWGHHLHFQVQVPLYGEDYYWGRSVDITFDDVDINGGRPRVINSWCNDLDFCTWPDDVCNDFRAPYTSQNVISTDAVPPAGDLFAPLENITFQTSTIRLEGWATDEGSGLKSAQFIAYYDGSWNDVGPAFSDILFSYEWDWCADDVPDGPLSLALHLTDNQGNQNLDLPGLRHAVKHYACPQTPKCSPAVDQVALFAEGNYGGECQNLDIGDYPASSSFGAVGNDNTASIMVGANVMATLFSEANYQGRGETIIADDPNLAENRIGGDALSSIKVMSRDISPSVPGLQWPDDGSTFSEADSLSLVWNDMGGTAHFRASLDGPSGAVTTPWGTSPAWNLGTLSPGAYTWQVQAGNDYGESVWSSAHSFTINDDTTPPPASVTAPFSDTLEGDTSGWIVSGLWHLTENDAHSTSHSWWYSQPISGTYDTGSVNSGDLTTPPITIPIATDPYILEFWYKYETESPYAHWDQRGVQVSIDDGAFANIYQLENDPTGAWLRATINLSPYYDPGAVHALRVRFHFATLDDINNAHAGWYIDDLQVAAATIPSCSDTNEPNNTPSQATGIAYNDSVTGVICPGGDYDYYTFTGSAGDHIVADIDAKSAGSTLDAILYLLDDDGTSELAVHDDEVLGVRQDPHLGYALPRDGSYHLKIQAWDHPMGTGAYTLTLFTDGGNPSINNFSPSDGIYLPAASIPIRASVDDGLSGVSHVQFLRYANGWAEISQDWDGSDGWGADFDTTGLSEGNEIAFYARAFDWAGNWNGTGAWNLTLDFTPPDTSADPLLNPAESTAIHLNWSATDNLAGIRQYDIRIKINDNSWQNLAGDLSPSITEWWSIGAAGNNYAFRIRAIDDAGNIEAYLDGAEVSTSIPGMSTLCSAPDAWDISEFVNDNSPISATSISIGVQTHNFCNPSASDRLNDEDWFRFSAAAGESYIVSALPQHKSAAVVIDLYAADGSTLLAKTEPAEFGQPTTLNWTATQDGEIFIKLYHLDGRVAGNAVDYQVMLSNTVLYLPVIFR